MPAYKIVINWIDFNTTLQDDMYEVDVYSEQNKLIVHKECAKNNLSKVLMECIEN